MGTFCIIVWQDASAAVSSFNNCDIKQTIDLLSVHFNLSYEIILLLRALFVRKKNYEPKCYPFNKAYI